MAAQRVPKTGLLPICIKLYDDVVPECRAGFDGFIRRIAAGFEARGITVHTAQVCRVDSEFEAAIAQFEADGVDCIVTLYLAYSPSFGITRCVLQY